MSCQVKWCKNRSDRTKTNPGITFHRFPKNNQVWRKDWIQIIRNCNGDNEWIPSKYSVICCRHFKPTDIYTTKGGFRRVVRYAVPQKFLFETTYLAEEQPAEVSFNSNPSQESPSVNVSALIQPGFSSTIIQRGWSPNEPNIPNALRGSAPVFVSLPEQPCFSNTVLQKEEQLAEPNISNDLQESIPETGSKALEHPDTSTLIFQKEQPAESNISSSIQKKSSKIGAAEEQVLSILYSPRKLRLKQSLIQKQDIIKKQKRAIKTLKQKVKRLQNRNKSLKNILKSLKENNKLIQKHLID